MIWDAFLLNDELDMLECRLVELGDVVNRFVIVEANVTFTGQPKPSHYLASQERFSAWRDKIIHVWGTALPPGDDPWSREHAQRELIGTALDGAQPDDLVMVSDVDEIPNPSTVRDLQPGGMVALEQNYCAFAVDWQMPLNWFGTVACRRGDIPGLQLMRDRRNGIPSVPNGGWHLSWIGSNAQNLGKIECFSHTEIVPEVRAGLEADIYRRDGACLSVFGDVKMIPVDVDDTWPRWIAERRCPKDWFRDDRSKALS